MTELTRRQVLLSTAALGAAGLAGCVGDSTDDGNAGGGNGEGDNGGDNENGNSDDGNDGDGSTDDGNGDEGSTDDDGSENDEDGNAADGTTDPTVTIETVNTDCAQGTADTASFDWGEDVITVQGTSPAPNPCHEAVLEESSVEGESFTLVVDVADATEGGICQDCLGKVEYEATIDVESPSEISEGTVRHVQGGTHGVAVESDSAGAGEAGDVAVRDASIETVDASCSTGEERERLVAASRTAGGVAVDGVLQTPDPCHRAVLAGTSMRDGQLRVEVAPESTLGEGEVCQQCLGEVQYAAEVVLSNPGAVSGVTVGHEGGDEFTFEPDDLDSE